MVLSFVQKENENGAIFLIKDGRIILIKSLLANTTVSYSSLFELCLLKIIF